MVSLCISINFCSRLQRCRRKAATCAEEAHGVVLQKGKGVVNVDKYEQLTYDLHFPCILRIVLFYGRI